MSKKPEKIKLSTLFYIYEQGSVLIDWTNGPSIAPLASAGLLRITSAKGPIKCLEASLNKKGLKIVKSALKETKHD